MAIIIVMMFITVGYAMVVDEESFDEDTLYQHNTLPTFLDGQYDGLVPYSELFKQGDTGLGTFDGVDGEMIAFDGDFYQIKGDGSVRVAEGGMTAPLAMVTWFDVDGSRSCTTMNITVFKESLDDMRISDNLIHVFLGKGAVSGITTRSYDVQEKPYRPLANVSANTFDAENVSGTLVIMWFPPSLGEVNLNDYHMHFLADDMSIGGHVLDMQIENMDVDMDITPGYSLMMPINDDFIDWDGGIDYSVE